MAGLLIGLAAFLLLDNVIDFPHEKMLKRENKALRAELDILNRRIDVAQAVVEDIAERDNNFYRVMMQAERISDAQRYSGLDREYRYNKLMSMADNELIEQLSGKMDMLDRELYVQIKSFDKLKEMAGRQKDKLAHIPAIQPISEKDMKQMASGYGYRRDPIYGTGKFHEGMDFAANLGTPVYATGNATVVSAEWNSGYGNMVELDHGYNYVTRYAHLSAMNVRPGQKVTRGDLIGRVGNTGKSTGPHLHYEVRYNGVPQNPVNYYYYDLTPEQYNEMLQLAENAGHVMD
jgi:murein DD-endopeptidase MepM/ murein hydrolase activator NlpD